MTEVVSVRDLRNKGADVLRRVERGERMVVTRDGDPVGEIVPLPKPGLSAEELVRRRRHLPTVDPELLRSDVDRVLDPTL